MRKFNTHLLILTALLVGNFATGQTDSTEILPDTVPTKLEKIETLPSSNDIEWSDEVSDEEVELVDEDSTKYLDEARENAKRAYLESKRWEAIEVPEKWKNESVVILYKEERDTYINNTSETIRHTSTVRTRLKLQDPVAVQQFSQFFFIDGEIKDRKVTILSTESSVFVIKPDGQRIDIDLSAESENSTSIPDFFKVPGINLEYRKTAISNLEPGDILDFTHSYEEEQSLSSGIINQGFSLIPEEYPSLGKAQVFEMEGSGLNLNIQALNGASEPFEYFEENNSNLFVHYSGEMEALDEQRWEFLYRNQPVIKYAVINDERIDEDWEVPAFGHSPLGEVQIKKLCAGIHYAEMSRKALAAHAFVQNIIRRSYRKNWEKSETSETEKFKTYYYLYRRSYYEQYAAETNMSLVDFYKGLRRFASTYGLTEPKLAVVGSRYIGGIDEAVMYSEVQFLIMLGDGSDAIFLTTPGPYSQFRDEQVWFQSEVVEYYKKPTRTYYPYGFTGNYDYGKLIEHKSEYFNNPEEHLNYTETTIKLNLDSALAHMQSTNTFTGAYRSDYRSELRVLDPIPRFMPLKGKKKIQEAERKNAAYREAIARHRNFKREGRLETEYMDLRYGNCTVTDSGGVLDGALTVEETYSVGRILHPAGDDYIFDIGSLIGSHIALEEEEYDRNVDVWLAHPRKLEYNFRVEIPAGYEVVGVSELPMEVDNFDGHFSVNVEPSPDGSELQIEAKKIYRNQHVKADYWLLMTEFLDAAWEFSQKKVLLKKKAS